MFDYFFCTVKPKVIRFAPVYPILYFKLKANLICEKRLIKEK